MKKTSEFVSEGHPDKFCDQVADRILDTCLENCNNEQERKQVRTAIECLAKDNLLMVSGEIAMPEFVWQKIDVEKIAKQVWKESGYEHNGTLTVVNNIKPQSADIAVGKGTGTNFGGAGDQGIMVGYATNETEEMLPLEYVLARDMCMRMKEMRDSGMMPWMQSDCKTQITLMDNMMASSVVIAAQHVEGMENEIMQMRSEIIEKVIKPVLEMRNVRLPHDKNIAINGTGKFVIGGTLGDAGVVGRKIVVDAYGPRIPVGGGAYSGKDFTKVDRSGAYMARHMAKHVVNFSIEGAKECTVKMAYCIGKTQPEMVTALTDTGKDVSGYIMDVFPDLSPEFIIDYFSMHDPKGWSYYETASYGHYGKSNMPWESIRSS